MHCYGIRSAWILFQLAENAVDKIADAEKVLDRNFISILL
jgi:hypothetical protein